MTLAINFASVFLFFAIRNSCSALTKSALPPISHRPSIILLLMITNTVYFVFNYLLRFNYSRKMFPKYESYSRFMFFKQTSLCDTSAYVTLAARDILRMHARLADFRIFRLTVLMRRNNSVLFAEVAVLYCLHCHHRRAFSFY